MCMNLFYGFQISKICKNGSEGASKMEEKDNFWCLTPQTQKREVKTNYFCKDDRTSDYLVKNKFF